MTNNILLKDYPTLASAKEIEEISAVLKPYGIENFAYCRYFFDHTSYVFNSHYQSHYHHLNQGYTFCPHIPNDIKNNKFYCFPGLDTSFGYSQAMHDHQSFFNLGNFFCLFEKFNDYFDAYLFGAKADNSSIINFYLNNIDFLDNFKFYFKEKARKLIVKARENKILVPEPMRPCITSWKPSILAPTEHELLSQIKPTKHYILNHLGQDMSITKKEFNVLKNLALGSTVKETGKLLNLSPRTVETYFNNVRNKLNLEKKSEILKLIAENKLLNF